MRRLLCVLMMVFGLISVASAQNGALQGFCTQGGLPAKTSGLSSTNNLQGIIPSCTVTVYLTGTQTLATLYSNIGGTPQSNPFTATAVGGSQPGSWLAYAANNQQYDVVLSGGIAPNTYPAPVTVMTAAGTSGSFGSYLPLSGGTLYGSLFAPNINGEIYPAECGSSNPASWCTGTTADAWIRAACNQLPASGGIINMLGLTGTIAASVPCSTPNKQVVMLEDPSSLLTITENDGLTTFPIDNGSSILGPGAGQCTFAGGIHLSATANITAIVAPAHVDRTQEDFQASGLCMYGATGATVGQALIYDYGTFANTTFTGNNLFFCNTACIKIVDAGGVWLNNNWANVSDGNSSITGTPLIIQGTGLGAGCNIGPVTVIQGQYEHALGGGPEIDIKGDGTGYVLACDIHVRDVGIERNGVGTADVTGISVADCRNCSVENVIETGVAGGTAEIAIIQNLTQTVNLGSISNVVIQNIDNLGSYTNTLTDNTPNGSTIPFSTQPYIATYYSNPGYVTPPVLPGTVLQSVGADFMSGAGNFATGSGTYGTNFGPTGCISPVNCTYTRTNTTAPPGSTYSQEIQITSNTGGSIGYNGIQYVPSVSFIGGQTYIATFWGKGDGTFTGLPTFLLANTVSGTSACINTSNAGFTTEWTIYSFICQPKNAGTSYLIAAALTIPVGATGTFYIGDFTFAQVQSLSPNTLVAAVTPFGIGPATAAQQTITINGQACQLQGTCSVTSSGVPTVNSNAGPLVMSFSAGAGSCSTSGGTTTCTFTGSGSGGGSVTNFIATAGSWPSWLAPSVATSTTTPTLSVLAAAIPNSALANSTIQLGSSAAVPLGSAITSVTGLTVNGILLNAAGSSSLFLNQAGSYTAPSFTSEFPITIGSTSIAKNSTTTSIAGLTVNGVTLSSTGSSSLFLTQAGTYATPTGVTTTNALTMNNSGSGAASGASFNGASAITLSYNTIGAAPLASPTFTGTVTIPVTGSSQCLQVNSSGVISGSGATCGGGGGGAVNTVSNSDGTLTISPTTGAVVASIALGHANTWTALQTFGTNISLGGETVTGATGTGGVNVFATSPTLVTPNLGTPSAVTLTNGTGLPWTGLTGTPSTTQVPVQSLTTTGTGAATLSAGVLNVPTGTQTICSGTISLGTTAIASGAAATTQTQTCSGLASTDNIELDFNGSPLGVTGYVPSANGILTIIKWPSINTINVSVVNNTQSSITPGAITVNYRVLR